MIDPFFSNVVALLHFDGADASTVFGDIKGKTWTAAGNAQIDTAQSKFGGASGLFDGAGDYLVSQTSADFIYGDGDFTIEFWMRRNTDAATVVVFDGRPTTEGNQVVLYVPSGTGKMTFFRAGSNRISSSTTMTAGVWRHIALCRKAGTTRLFIDGLQEGGDLADTTFYVDTRVTIGADRDGAASFFDGWIDDLRITNGVARYTTAFTPPTAAFHDAGIPTTRAYGFVS